MRGRLVVQLVGVALFVVGPDAARAQGRVRPALGPGSYFPLQVGNEWVYLRTSVSGVAQWKATVVEEVAPDRSRRYFSLANYFPGPARLVQVDARGSVGEHDPRGTRDHLWYLLGARVGTSWEVELAPSPVATPGADCIDGAKAVLASRSEVAKVPAGEFTDVVRVDFRSPCVDAGLVSEWFAPGVGLIRRAEDSFAGPVVSELASAQVSGAPMPRLPYTTALTLDSPAYTNDLMPPVDPERLPIVRAGFVVRNDTDRPLELSFSGCKSVALEVRDFEGNLMLEARGDDAGCCACDNIVRVTLVRDLLMVPASFRLARAGGEPLVDGRYVVKATLVTLDPPAIRPSASAVVDVRSVY